ncbi:unannotated protein [freshwater metagenome]|uniref:Unannotated protein n=1 Tax=freshwater metagenome TaxID=449393 RepID=A0A6J6V2D8_9ZZZZ|nr:5-oxoprolinase/urea amidolyase family protein [Actinomycetota bacterium]
MGSSALRVAATGPSVLLQDLGRPGLAHLGVPRSGALDAPAAALARRLVGGAADDAVLEVLLGGLEVVLEADPGSGAWVAVTGAPCSVAVDGRAAPHGRAVWVPAGSRLVLGRPASGLRSYLAVDGGLPVAEVLGSRSSDTLAGVGPAPVRAGDRLPVGVRRGEPGNAEVPPARATGPLRLHPGPRSAWCEDPLAALTSGAWTVGADSDRVGLRLHGDPLARRRTEELPSEGMVLGAVQVPPDGQPVVFLADHPPTGGYPVVAVVEEADLWRCAQLRPGERVRFTRAR